MMMKSENELAMVVAFYLSKFGNEGLDKLGYGSYRKAFYGIGHLLGVNANSVKNWRDEFDPYYDNERKGWYQRSIRPSRQRIILAFDDLSEQALRAVVLDIINPVARPKVEAELRSTLKEIKNLEGKKRTKTETIYTPRGPTGRLAEEFFLTSFHAGMTPFEGDLRDRRDDGTGFDFEIINVDSRLFIEIKGLSKQSGNITFTDKEWKIAIKTHNNYYLGLVTQIRDTPRIGFVQDPAHNLAPSYYAYTTVSVNWTINTTQIPNIEYL